MATPQEKLAQALKALKKLQDQGNTAIKTSELSRINRERLSDNGFIRQIIQGWYIIVPPDEQQGDSTSWYANYWNFCTRYLADRYGDSYCISAEQSLLLHAGNQTVPHQLIIRATNGTNSSTALPHGTSLFTMKSTLPEKAEIIEHEGVRMLTLASAFVNCSPTVFTGNTTDVRTALAMVPDASEILGLLLEGGHSTIAGRLAGAFRNIGRDKIADEIVKTMQKAGYDVRENDPFEDKPPVELSIRDKSPYVNRIRLMWHKMREVVIQHFPDSPGLPKDQVKYMKEVEDIYVTDAYHSLSIERYRVTVELIERVRSSEWDPKGNEADRRQRDAMAARGYWLASQRVRESIKLILNNENPGKVVDDDHGDWYRELFAPSVTSGILKASDLAGYRNDQVYIGGSMHVPLNKDAVRDAMPELFDLLRKEENAAVRAVLGHFIFVFIHPYMDGNGRMGRFMMNVMLASGGYPWTVIPVEERETYMKALETASVEEDIKPFAKFIGWLVEEGLKGTPMAKINQVMEEKPGVEFPPYHFYQGSDKVKYETLKIYVDEQFSALRLYNLQITPMQARNGLNMIVVVEGDGTREEHRFKLSELFVNPKLEHHLFFVTDTVQHVDIDLPEGRKWVTIRMEMLMPVEEYNIQLACEYLTI